MSCQHVDGGEREAADVAQRLQTQLAGTPFTHHQHGGGAVGERSGVGGGHRAVSPVKHRFELGVTRQIGAFADVVVPPSGDL